MNPKIEAAARLLAAQKMGLQNDLQEKKIPDELWLQCVEEATAEHLAVEKVLTALTMCLKDAGSKPRPYKGSIKCPKCGNRLNYVAKTSARGTIWGMCTTPNCISWMV